MKTLRLIFLAICLSAFSAERANAELPPGTVRVTAPALSVRAGPGPDFPIVSRVGEGTLLKVIEIRPGWQRVRRPEGVLGWVSAAGTVRVN
jgi:SH3-like domain-containing protein